MDVGHYGFDCKMRFFQDNDLEIDVRWYEAPVGAKWFPDFHLFGNGDLASIQGEWFGPGQVLDTRKYVADPIGPPNVDGSSFLGSLEQYQQGTVYPGIPLNCQTNGVCLACGPLPPDCATFGALYPFLKLTILAVRTKKPIPLGYAGLVLPMAWGVDCQYVAPTLGDPMTACQLTVVLIWDQFQSVAQLTGISGSFFLCRYQTFRPTFLAQFRKVQIGTATICSPDNKEEWDFDVSTP